MSEEKATYDVFVSYASDDKKFVQQLVPALRAKGLAVWYDEGQLRVGDTALRKVEEGLEQSMYFVVVVSPNLLSRQWPQFEVGVALGRGKKDRILPIYLKVQQPEMAKSLPILAGKRGISAEDYSIDDIAGLVAKVVKGEAAADNAE
jgi:hypothetical protein